MEADKVKQANYLESIKNIDKNQLVYIDESGIDLSICRERGWSKIGKIITGRKSGKYYQRINIIAGLNDKKPIAPFIFRGSCNRVLFTNWVELSLIKELIKGQVVIMDNASFHKSERVKELIESVGCKLIFLPPYSPELNPIEKFWANMKRWIRNHINNYNNLT